MTGHVMMSCTAAIQTHIRDTLLLNTHAIQTSELLTKQPQYLTVRLQAMVAPRHANAGKGHPQQFPLAHINTAIQRPPVPPLSYTADILCFFL
jgi:hypothetical protein